MLKVKLYVGRDQNETLEKISKYKHILNSYSEIGHLYLQIRISSNSSNVEVINDIFLFLEEDIFKKFAKSINSLTILNSNLSYMSNDEMDIYLIKILSPLKILKMFSFEDEILEGDLPDRHILSRIVNLIKTKRLVLP